MSNAVAVKTSTNEKPPKGDKPKGGKGQGGSGERYDDTEEAKKQQQHIKDLDLQMKEVQGKLVGYRSFPPRYPLS